MYIAQKERVIRIISDNPGITCKSLSLTLEVNRETVKYWIIELEERGLIFRKNKGCIKMLFTNKVPSVCPEKESKTTLELQLWFNDLIRGIALS